MIGIDHTPKPRLYAPKGADRSCARPGLRQRARVHQSTPIRGNKPITIGHDYSFIGQIDVTSSDTWLAALDVQRIASRWTAVEVGLSQLIELARRCQDWLVIAGDCEYSIPLTVACLAQVEHLSCVFRFPAGDLQVRSNRKLYGKPPPHAGFGHPRWHGSLFRLNDPCTWWAPDEEQSWTETDEQGRSWTIRLRRWRDLHFREARRFWFDVVLVEVTDQHGQPRFRRLWWLLVCGRRSLSLADCRAIYQRRPVMEHFNRFHKQRLLFNAAQFSDTQHEEKFMWGCPNSSKISLWPTEETTLQPTVIWYAENN